MRQHQRAHGRDQPAPHLPLRLPPGRVPGRLPGHPGHLPRGQDRRSDRLLGRQHCSGLQLARHALHASARAAGRDARAHRHRCHAGAGRLLQADLRQPVAVLRVQHSDQHWLPVVALDHGQHRVVQQGRQHLAGVRQRRGAGHQRRHDVRCASPEPRCYRERQRCRLGLDRHQRGLPHCRWHVPRRHLLGARHAVVPGRDPARYACGQHLPAGQLPRHGLVALAHADHHLDRVPEHADVRRSGVRRQRRRHQRRRADHEPGRCQLLQPLLRVRDRR